MTDWYVNFGNGSTTGYYAVAQWAASTAYTVGQIVRQLATPAVGSERCFRCTTAGTSGASEPTWNLANNATTTSGTAVFTAVTGQAAYNWSAPFARWATPAASGAGFAVGGDRIFVRSDHAETQSTNLAVTFAGSDASPLQIICVNNGSIPPASTDVVSVPTASTSITGSTVMTLTNTVDFSGMAFNVTSGAGGAGNRIVFDANASARCMKFTNCSFNIPGTTSGAVIEVGLNGGGNTLHRMEWNNVSVSFGSTGDSIVVANGDLIWNNSVALNGGSAPTTLFTVPSIPVGRIFCDGVDFNALGSGSTLVGTSTSSTQYTLFNNCRFNAAVTPAATPTTPGHRVDVTTSDSTGAITRSEAYRYSGNLTTETTYTRIGGATDGASNAFSWKLASNANASGVVPVQSFQAVEWNSKTGSAVTATVEIESSTTLTNADVWMVVEYLGSSSSPLSSAVSTKAALLSTPSNITASSASWNGSLGSAVHQKLQASFTAQMAGWVRVTVYLGKPSQTVYVDPAITLS